MSFDVELLVGNSIEGENTRSNEIESFFLKKVNENFKTSNGTFI